MITSRPRRPHRAPVGLGSTLDVDSVGFVGREATCRLLDALVASASAGGGSLLILGEPGIGKSALLRRLAEGSAFRVLTVRGSQNESVLPYAAVADLLIPLGDRLPALRGVQRKALEVALALDEGPGPGRLAVCAGGLSLLVAAAEEEPLVILVDDLQWIDDDSRQLLLFIARRLGSERVVMILADRDRPGGPPVGPELSTIRLSGLSSGECRELIEGHGLQVTVGQLERIVESTGGNPVAVLEAASRVQSAGGAGSDRVGAVEQSWGAVLADLPEQTQQALFVLAVAQGPGLPALPVLLSAVRLSLADLIDAERLGLVRVEAGEVDLCPPLLRQLLVDRTPIAVKARVYEALAALADAEERAWFLSLAAFGPDPAIAEELASAAVAAQARGAHSAAGRLLKRSAELLESAPLRARRLVLAGVQALLSGDAAHAEEWCAEAVTLDDAPALVARATMVRSSALTWIGHPQAAFDELIRVAGQLEATEPHTAAELYCAATMPGGLVGDLRRSVWAAQRGESLHLRAGVSPSFQASVMSAKALIAVGASGAGEGALSATGDMLASIDVVAEQQGLVALAQCHTWVEDFDIARHLSNRTIDIARAQGAALVLAFALGVRAELETWTGRWSEAHADAEESLKWAADLNQHGAAGFGLVTLARLEAARGQRDLAEKHVARCREEVGPFGIGSLLVYEAAALGLDALTWGEFEAARDHLELAWLHANTFRLGNALVVPFAADLAEARFRCGDHEGAREPVEWLRARALKGSRYAAAVAARCEGLMAHDCEDSLRAFAAARASLSGSSMPFELARTLLNEGEQLRRGRQVGPARGVLRRAQRIFEGLGARPWADRAARELTAAGVPARRLGSAAAEDVDRLTAQELQVARMVAHGRNNVETATALFMSRKTVEAHLTRIYRKLQIRSRTELVAVLLAGQSDGVSRSWNPPPR